MTGTVQDTAPDTEPLPYPILRTDPTEPPAEYATLRRDRPVCPISLATGDPAWLLVKHDDLKSVLADRRFSRAAAFDEGAPRMQSALPNPDSLLNMDPPRHTRVRKLAAQAFTIRRVEGLRPDIERIMDDLLSDLARMTPPVDLFQVFARPLPRRMICGMLGVPIEDREKFEDWTRRILSFDQEYTEQEMAQALVDLKNYFVRLAADRAEGDTGLIQALAVIADDQGTLTENELASLGSALLIGGHDSSATVLASSVLTLARHPEQLARLQADPSLWPNAVEELLRLNNPGGAISHRIAMEDITIGDTLIREREAVVVHMGSACRDEDLFADPDTFDIDREVTTQMTFGHGPHFCIGAPLAKVEMAIGLRRLFASFPTLRLAVPPESLKWRDYAGLGGFEDMMVTW